MLAQATKVTKRVPSKQRKRSLNAVVFNPQNQPANRANQCVTLIFKAACFKFCWLAARRLHPPFQVLLPKWIFVNLHRSKCDDLRACKHFILVFFLRKTDMQFLSKGCKTLAINSKYLYKVTFPRLKDYHAVQKGISI